MLARRFRFFVCNTYYINPLLSGPQTHGFLYSKHLGSLRARLTNKSVFLSFPLKRWRKISGAVPY